MPTEPRRPPDRGSRLARPAHPVRGLGLDLPRDRGRGRDDPAVPHGGHPVRDRRDGADGLVAPAGARLVRRPESARVARHDHRRHAAARWRHGHGRVRRADDPVGHRGPAHRDDAGLGRDLRARLPRRAAAADRRRSASSSASSGVAILVGPTILGQTGALDPLGLAAIIVSPIAWSLGSLYASHRATLPRQPLVATGTQMLAGGAVLALMAGVTGEFGRFDPAAVSRRFDRARSST